MCPTIGVWALAARITFAITPSSAACERVFALVNNLFGDEQLSALKDYYKQLTDWSHTSLSPFSVGAFFALTALPLQPVVKTSQRARLPPPTSKCMACKKADGELIACSFCTAVYCNSDRCLGAAKLSNELAASACFPWACPACFKKGIASVQRTVLKPTGQRPAGARKPRKSRKK